MLERDREYWIAGDGRVGVLAAGAERPPDAVLAFSSLDELRTLTSQWPMRRLVSVWNKLPDKCSVTRFENRTIALARLWRAMESIEEQSAPSAEEKAKKKQPARRTKAESILGLLRAPGGATLAALMEATGWQAHSVRGFVSRKLSKQPGLQVTSFRRDGHRVYSVAPVEVREAPE